jgi:ribosomal protein S12 methylthiotransferase
MRVGIVTLGCDKNTVDSEYWAGALARSGVEVVAAGPQPDGNDLDAVLINTCGFIDAAKAQSIQTIVGWLEHKRRRAAAPGGARLRVFVGGCLTQRYREQMVRELPEVDGFLGVGDFERVADLIRSPAGAAGAVNMIRELPSVEVRADTPRLPLGPAAPHAFLKIADGCNHHCTFCAIPSFKGRLRSTAREIVLAEARLLVSRGVREINIVAQDTSDYGKDIYGGQYGIADLLADLAAIPGDFWLRLFYFYPGGITPAFLDAMTASPKIVRYLDMPLQHLDPDMLRRMKRPHREVNTFEAVGRLRAAVPGIALRTTFIVGFPGETEAEFGRLLDGAARLRLNRVGVFPYSVEDGTPSADMRPRVNKPVQKRRMDRLMRQQARISAELLAGRLGATIRVLVEQQVEEGCYIGRSEGDAPEVDGFVRIRAPGGLRVGDFAEVRVTGSDIHDLFGEA